MKAEAIQTVAVLGLGTMGHGIAQAFAAGGCDVRCWDETRAARDTLTERIAASLRQFVAAGLTDAATAAQTLQRTTLCDSQADAVGTAAFVTEAITEDLAAKQEFFARLESDVAPQTILASNSSTFPISRTAARMQHRERAVLTHWFNPPQIVPVVEVVPGQATDPSTTSTTIALLERIGKTPVRVNREIPGFLVNRVQMAMYREIWDLLDRGIATAAELDRAIRGSMGMRLAALGPLEINDFAGLDVTASVYETLISDLRRDTDLPAVIRQLVDQGRWGAKAGAGVFDYTPESLAQRTSRRDRLYLALRTLLAAADRPDESDCSARRG